VERFLSRPGSVSAQFLAPRETESARLQRYQSITMPCTATTAAGVIIVAVLIGCNKPAPQPTGRSISTKEFTAESGQLKIVFRYPAEWELVPEALKNATLGIALVPADKEPGTRIEFLLLDGPDAKSAIDDLPLIPNSATTVSKELIDVDGHAFHRTEWYGHIPSTPIYRHYACLDGAVGDRFVSLRCYTTAMEGKGDEARARFKKWRKVFEAVLNSAKLGSAEAELAAY
jgi:hypothetical protein